MTTLPAIDYAAMCAGITAPGDIVSVTQRDGSTTVYLARFGQDVTMQVDDSEQIPVATAHAVVKALGAPPGTPVMSMAGGLVHVACWMDESFDAVQAGRTTWNGGQPCTEPRK